jgi:hypothetical protein
MIGRFIHLLVEIIVAICREARSKILNAGLTSKN